MTATPAESPESGAGEALFLPDGPGLVPTDRARGPWSPDALHGGPVAALVARSAERHGDSPHDGLQLARITLELLRPVPLAPLTVTASVVKPGRKVQLLDISVVAGGVEVVKARALRLRIDPDQPAVGLSTPEDRPPEPPERWAAAAAMVDRYPAFHNRGVEMRFVGGREDGRGPATVWLRLTCPVVLGEKTTPFQRASAVADFSNGVSSELDFLTSSFVNADLTVSIYRPPVGEWVCLDARTRYGSPGVGAAESALWDAEGRIGRALQHLVVEARS
jgi:Thioesterase-like superfamily